MTIAVSIGRLAHVGVVLPRPADADARNVPLLRAAPAVAAAADTGRHVTVGAT